MKTILVDDEMWSMLQFRDMCSDAPEIELVGEFSSASEALRYAEDHTVEFALLDIEMPEMNGVELARRLRELNPEVIIVFLTGHKQYLEDFIQMKADYYVLKPYTPEDVQDVLARVRLLSGRLRKSVFFRTFGPFLMYVDGKPYSFRREKPRELLALLVDKRGAPLTGREALQTLWPDRDSSDTSLFRMTVARLREELSQAGVGDLIVSTAGGKSLDMSRVDCDLYDFLQGRNWKDFRGEYLPEYAWGETTLADLEEQYARRLSAEARKDSE